MEDESQNRQVCVFNEEFLYHIWDGRHYSNNLKTVSGKSLTLIFNGHFNTDRGPDFKNAVFQLEGEYIRGDVEIHINTYDWVSHKHYQDTNFNNVALHVVYKHNSSLAYTIKENGELLEILELKPYLDEEISKLMERYGVEPNFRDKSCDFFNGLEPDQMVQLLSRIGRERVQSKIKRFEGLLIFSDFNQIMYQGLLETCGYSKNKINMITLSEIMNWSEFTAKKGNYQTQLSENLTRSGLDKLLKREKRSSEEPIKWITFRVRPSNNPAIRYCQMFTLLFSALDGGLIKSILKLFDDLPGKPILANRLILKRFTELFQSTEIYGREIKKPGRSALRRILFNVIYPISILYYDKIGESGMSDPIWSYVEEFGKLGDNHIIKTMRSYLTENQYRYLKKEILRQGVLKIYFDNCEYFTCNACKLRKEHLLSEM